MGEIREKPARQSQQAEKSRVGHFRGGETPEVPQGDGQHTALRGAHQQDASADVAQRGLQ